MKKEEAKEFCVMTPDVRTEHVGTRIKQRVNYLYLPKGVFCKEALQKDIEAGAALYQPYLETLKRKDTRVNIITAPTYEDGLRAVSYLAGVHAIIDECYDVECDEEEDEPLDEMTLSEIEEDNGDAGLADIEYDLEDLFGDEDWDPEMSDDEGFESEVGKFSESYRKIPLINLCEVARYDNMNDGLGGSGMSFFNMQVRTRVDQNAPWWTKCEKEAVCVYLKDDMGFFGCFGTAGVYNGVTLDDQSIECLKHFQTNRRVYVLLETGFIPEHDISIQKTMLEYTANYFCTESKKETRLPYYQKLLVATAQKYGFRFSSQIDLPLLTEKLGGIDGHFPCGKFEKIMKYFQHVEAEKLLKPNDFKELGLSTMISVVGANNPETAKMDTNLAGLEDVKKQLHNIIQVMEFQKKREKKGIMGGSFHNTHVFLGAPGTAKTTAAKYLAEEMQKRGLIRGDRFISLSGAMLKGEFVGHTAPKVHSIFQQYDAIFIDEAYSLCEGHSGMVDSYSQEALAQLAIELEEHSTDKLVIFAGYGGKDVAPKDNKMLKFLQENPGISSRIGSTVYFESYSARQTLAVARKLAELADLKLPTDSDQLILDYFGKRQGARDFGNGREARVFIEQCQRHLAERVSEKENPTTKELKSITLEDVRKSVKDLEASLKNRLGQEGRRVGLV